MEKNCLMSAKDIYNMVKHPHADFSASEDGQKIHICAGHSTKCNDAIPRCCQHDSPHMRTGFSIWHYGYFDVLKQEPGKEHFQDETHRPKVHRGEKGAQNEGYQVLYGT